MKRASPGKTRKPKWLYLVTPEDTTMCIDPEHQAQTCSGAPGCLKSALWILTSILVGVAIGQL